MGCGQHQFFTTLMAPLTAKLRLYGAAFRRRTFAGPKLLAIDGALGMPGFQLQPGQTYNARFEIYAGPKLYHRLANFRTMRPR